jgi:hypothetical protein
MQEHREITVLCVDTFMSRGSKEVTFDPAIR